MFRKSLIPAACVTALLGFGLPATAQLTDMAKKTGHAVGEAGKEVGSATKKGATKVGSATKKGAKTVGHETKHVVTGAPKNKTGK